MRKLFIVTESGADLPKKYVDRYQIEVIPMHIMMGDKEYLDGQLDIQHIYDYFKDTKKVPSTAAANPSQYQEVFERITAKNPGCFIIHIGYSAEASCTFANACIASQDMHNVYHIDSKNVSGGESAIIIKAAELIEKNPDMDPAELKLKVEAYAARAKMSFIPGRLEFLKAGGRVSNASYIGATVLNIKPMIEIIEGKLIATKKYRGSINKIIEKYFEEYVHRHNLELEQLFCIFSMGVEEAVLQKIEQISKQKGFKKMIRVQTGAVITCHCGPGGIGLSGFEKE
ncbi:DegV family protein [[Clostridium] fimetarium]|uniref:EDD domain protein, DegV family/intein N-terminal splicing region n=1 Tax=[Clostridium] fimetarium TaxID=99656 RepID=A0A1I0RFP2_9FIRM|nr:DegV family protein [[Clostridium] fimetarium]SEW39660.1 EDD domain protein, DegV family/intein N-terminal splicing region [[Clostridium] fimetarium]